MRLSEVSQPKKIAAFALGRMNPATIGHELLVNAIKAQPGDHFLFLTDRAPKLPDNPLTSEQKLDWARKSFNSIAVGLAKTVLTAADRLYKMGYTEVTFLEGENKLYNLLTQYNGVEKEMHNFNFDKINYVQLKRDPEAEDATGMSGTKLRNYVSNNDFEAFKKAITQAAQPYAEEMYKELQSALGVAEGLNEYRDQLWAWIQSKFPSTQWPKYVQRDFLYAKAKGLQSQKDLEDFLDEIQRDFGNCKWRLEKLPITLDIFTPKTQRMIKEREGGSSNPYQVPKDAERHALQQKMIQQKGVSDEPIIVAKLDNGYDLIEGWHRTIQHLKAFPQGYTGPAWVCTGATYGSESVDQGMAEGSLNEFAPGDSGASSYYAVTENFVNDFIEQKEEELQDRIDSGFSKEEIADMKQGFVSDMVYFEQVRDGFLKGMKPGFEAYQQGDTALKDQLGEYWLENDLPLNQDWEKIYGEPWGDDTGFNEGVAPAESISEAPAQPAQEPAPQNKTYTIVRGDNLTKIAKANNTTIQDIMKLNPKIKDPNLIYAGDSLVLPASPAAPAASAAPAQTTEPTQAAPAEPTQAAPAEPTQAAPAAPAQTTPPAQPQTPDPNAQKAKPEDPQTTTPVPTNQQKPVEEPAAKTTTATDQQQPAAEKPAAQTNVSKEPSPKPPSMIPSLDKKFKVNGKEMTGNEIAGRFNDLLDKLGLGESLHFTSRIGQYLLEALNNAELKELQSLLDAVRGDPFFADYLDPIADKLTANGLKWQAGSAPQTKSKKTKPKTSTTKYYKTDPETGEEVEVSKDEADAAEQNFRKSIGSSDDFEDEMDSKYDAIKKRAQGQGGKTTSSSSSSSTRSVTTTGGGSTTTSTTGGGGTTRFIAKYRDTDESKKLIAQAKAVRNEEMKAFVDDYDQKNPNADRFDAFKDPGYKALRKKEQDLKDQAKAAMEMVHPAGVMTPDGNIKYYGKGANKDGSWDGEQFSRKDKDQKESINLNRLKVLAGVS